MPKPKVLSGQEVVSIFEDFAFIVFSQKGSHIKLRRTTADGSKQTLVVPNHKQLDRGTMFSLYKQGSRYIPETDLQPHFFVK